MLPKIGVFIHLFNTELLYEFAFYVNNIRKKFDNTFVCITVNDTINLKILTHINTMISSAHILKIKNKGVDIGALFEQIKYVRQNNIRLDFILKIHSKLSCSKWRKELIHPLIHESTLELIKNNDIKNIGFIGAKKHLKKKSFDKDFKLNLIGLELLSKKYNYLNLNYEYFIGGTMFWINNSILSKITQELMDELSTNFSNGKPPCNLSSENIHPEYLFERIITGCLCKEYNNIYV